MFGAISGSFLRPGQELRSFDVYRQQSHKTDSGRVVHNEKVKLGSVRAILAVAKPEEKEKWRLLNHVVTYKIIQQGILPFEVKSGDIFEHGERQFFISASPYNIGDLSHWTIYYCSERGDVVNDSKNYR